MSRGILDGVLGHWVRTGNLWAAWTSVNHNAPLLACERWQLSTLM